MIEKKIFTFWDTEDLPELCKISIKSWELYCPDFEITILNSYNFQNYIKRPIPSEFNELTIQKKSNWIRCVLIYENGGIWFDTSILLTENINTWFNYDCDFFGIEDKNRVENWFFSAPKNSPLILEWIKEYEYAISIGARQYEKETMKLVYWKKWTYLYHQLCLLRACQKLSIDILKGNNSSYILKNVQELGYPKANTKHDFGKNWANKFKYNALRLGLKSSYKIPLYKLPNFTRSSAEIAIKSKIQKGSPLYLAGFRNNHKTNLKVYQYTVILLMRSTLWKIIKG